MDYSTGYQYSAGSGVTANGNLSPGTGSTNVTINDRLRNGREQQATAIHTDSTRGSVSVHETYSGPGLQNHTIIQRVTEVTKRNNLQVFSQQSLH